MDQITTYSNCLKRNEHLKTTQYRPVAVSQIWQNQFGVRASVLIFEEIYDSEATIRVVKITKYLLVLLRTDEHYFNFSGELIDPTFRKKWTSADGTPSGLRALECWPS